MPTARRARRGRPLHSVRDFVTPRLAFGHAEEDTAHATTSADERSAVSRRSIVTGHDRIRRSSAGRPVRRRAMGADRDRSDLRRGPETELVGVWSRTPAHAGSRRRGSVSRPTTPREHSSKRPTRSRSQSHHTRSRDSRRWQSRPAGGTGPRSPSPTTCRTPRARRRDRTGTRRFAARPHVPVPPRSSGSRER